LINGVCSSGKSSLATAFQKIAAEPYLHTGCDDFMPMLPPGYIGVEPSLFPEGVEPLLPDPVKSKLGFFCTKGSSTDKPLSVKVGYNGLKMIRGMQYAVAAMAEAGNNVIIADVIPLFILKEYARILNDFRVWVVHLKSDIETLEKREKERGDRLVGSAQSQLVAVQDLTHFDLQVDTTTKGVEECAQEIVAMLEDIEHPKTLQDLYHQTREEVLDLSPQMEPVPLY